MIRRPKMKTVAVCPRVWNGLDCHCEPLCQCGKRQHTSIHDQNFAKTLDGVHQYTPANTATGIPVAPNAPALPPQRSGGRQEKVVGHGLGGL